MIGAGRSVECAPEKLPSTVSGLIAIAVSLVGSMDGVMDVMGCSKDDFLEYCEGRQEPYLPELDRLIALIAREQAHIIASNQELLARMRAKLTQIRTKSEALQWQRDGASLMQSEFHVELRGDVVVVVRKGAPLFEDTQKAMAAAISAARDTGTKKILFDVRLADLANFYTHILRDVDLDPLLGLDASFRICVVGLREQANVMSFIVRVRKMHGWKAEWFVDMDEGLKWLASS